MRCGRLLMEVAPHMRRIRILLALLISLSLVTGSVASVWAAARMVAPMSDAGTDDGAMTDCQKTAKSQGSSDCPCCDAATKCPDAAACIKKCGSQIIGFLISHWRGAPQSTLPDRLSDPPEPPDWVSAPPAPPPRA